MMFVARSRAVVPVLIIAPLLLTSCLSHNRTIKRGKEPGETKLMEASKDQLIEAIGKYYGAIQSFSLEARMVMSTGSVYKGQIKDYSETVGYIDFHKPADIRVVGTLPIVGGVGLHMVSDGKFFKVSIPPKSRFYEGENEAPADSPNKFENIRPEMFLSAILIKPVNPETEKSMKLDDITESYAYYQLAIMRLTDRSEIEPLRRVTFDRVNLSMVEQREYATDGSLVSLSHYGDWKSYGDVQFPNHIDISRPKEEIAIELNVTKMDMNVPVADAKFVLNKPEGYELKVIGRPGTAPNEPPKGHK